MKPVVRKPGSNVASRIKPIHELPAVLTALIYGRSGTGKTTFSVTWPKPLLLVDIREKGSDSAVGTEGVDLLSVQTWEELEELYWYLMEGNHKYRTVVLDQVTQMQDLAKRKCLKDDGKSEDSVIFSQRIWGNISSLMITWIVNFRDLQDSGLNVCFLAQDREHAQEEDSGEGQIDPSVGARVIPSVSGFLNAAVKVIGNTFIRERFIQQEEKGKTRKQRLVEYAMRIGPHAVYSTKIRTTKGTAVPDVLVDPTYDKVMGIMRSGNTGTSTATSSNVKLIRRK